MIFPDTDESRERAGKIVGAGGLIAFRTDTFYGLGVNPFDPSAVSRLKAVKGRDDNKPILLLIADQDQLQLLIENRSGVFELLARELWPGPLTLVGRASVKLPRDITAGTNTVGVRLPNQAEVRSLVRRCGGALTATSANPAGSEPARSANEVLSYFPTGLDLILDGGEVTATMPSTVVDATGNAPVIIREGATSRERIEELCGTDF